MWRHSLLFSTAIKVRLLQNAPICRFYWNQKTRRGGNISISISSLALRERENALRRGHDLGPRRVKPQWEPARSYPLQFFFSRRANTATLMRKRDFLFRLREHESSERNAFDTRSS
jgi:hypothetical protein